MSQTDEPNKPPLSYAQAKKAFAAWMKRNLGAYSAAALSRELHAGRSEIRRFFKGERMPKKETVETKGWEKTLREKFGIPESEIKELFALFQDEGGPHPKQKPAWEWELNRTLRNIITEDNKEHRFVSNAEDRLHLKRGTLERLRDFQAPMPAQEFMAVFGWRETLQQEPYKRGWEGNRDAFDRCAYFAIGKRVKNANIHQQWAAAAIKTIRAAGRASGKTYAVERVVFPKKEYRGSKPDYKTYRALREQFREIGAGICRDYETGGPELRTALQPHRDQLYNLLPELTPAVIEFLATQDAAPQ